MNFYLISHDAVNCLRQTGSILLLVKLPYAPEKSHKDPLVVRQQAEPLATSLGLCQLVRLIRMTMYPKGARPNRWQSLHMVCKYRDHHKPVYPCGVSRRRQNGGIGLKCASLKVFGIMPSRRLLFVVGLSQ